MVFKKGVKCFGSLLVFVIMSLASVVVFSNDVSAGAFDYSYFRLYYVLYNSGTSGPPDYIPNWQTSGQLGYDSAPLSGVHGIKAVNAAVGNISVPSNSNYLSINSKYNVVFFTDSDYSGYLPSLDKRNLSVRAVTINGTDYRFESSNVDVYRTDWSCNVYGVNKTCRTYTFNVSFIVKDIPSTINSLVYGVGTNNQEPFIFTGAPLGMFVFFEYDRNNYANIEFAYDYNSAIMQQQVQLQQTIINQNNEYYNSEYQANNNISSQTPSDIEGATSSQTTSIIGVISSFVTSLNSYSATSCSLTLPFPSFAGGSTTVDPCSGKEIAPTIVQVASSLLLIGVFVPLAFIVLRMIYNEIRSWTNG